MSRYGRATTMGEITKEYLKRERFRRSFEQCGIVCNDPLQFDYDYLETIVTLKQVVDGAPELLAHLTKKRASACVEQWLCQSAVAQIEVGRYK